MSGLLQVADQLPITTSLLVAVASTAWALFILAWLAGPLKPHRRKLQAVKVRASHRRGR
jgi:hypothetical protein